jgi:hypothetical protein
VRGTNASGTTRSGVRCETRRGRLVDRDADYLDISNLLTALFGLIFALYALFRHFVTIERKVAQVAQGHSFSWIRLVHHFYCTFRTCDQAPQWGKIGKSGTSAIHIVHYNFRTFRT